MEFQQEEKKTLIFEPCLSGHHLEYLHHYYLGAKKRTQDNFIFYVPYSFNDLKCNYQWDDAPNIEFRYFSNKEIQKTEKGSYFIKKIRSSILLRNKIKETKSEKIILTALMAMLPIMLFFIPSGVRIRGIIYQIYLYNIGKLSRFRIFQDKFVYWLISSFHCIEKIYILNDEESATELNRIYNTNKFWFLPDPVPNVDFSKVENIRSELGIIEPEKVYLHFGGLTERKGTLDILKAIKTMDPTILRGKCFIFAGKIHNNINESFYTLLEDCKEKSHIIVFDEFCSYDKLYNLCFSSDVILMPYKITTLSSGVLGYASVFKKPVIGPGQNLLGRIIKKYEMGMAIESITPKSISLAIDKNIEYKGNDYTEKNSLSCFIDKILK